MFPWRTNPTRLPRPLAGATSRYARPANILFLQTPSESPFAGAMRRARKQGDCRGGLAAPGQTVFDG
jgi:hypothetical protein